MSKTYDMIATVDINLSSPIVDDASFDKILIVGPLPSTPPETAPVLCGAYASLEEVTDAGWSLDTDPVAKAAQVAFAQSPTPSVIYIAPAQSENSTEEDLKDTIERALGYSGWYCCCPVGEYTAEQLTAAAYLIESNEKIMAYTDSGSFASGTGEFTPAVHDGNADFFRTLAVYSHDVTGNGAYMNVAFAVKWLSFSAGSETAAFKQLALVSSADLTKAQMNALKNACVNYYISVGNRNVTMEGKVLGDEWADIIRFRDWLKNDMQVRAANVFILNPKVPFTDNGIALIQNAMLASLKAGQDAGGIAEDEFDEDENLIPGYQTSVPMSATLSASERASRRLTNCKFKARLSGAIHFAELTGSLSYEI